MNDMTDQSASQLPRELSLQEYIDGVRNGDRVILGKALTLVESSHLRHQSLAQDLLTKLLPHTGNAARIGITGMPGVGKSTFIETLGSMLTGRGLRVAVLAVDPSSDLTGGSILGDKTRMARLSVDDNAFIRSSPSAGTLGGVARKTRETMLICEAADFDVILVETIGVGQSETVVANMTDFFLALILPGAGDELQGIKRGLIELADLIVVNQADGEKETIAKHTAEEYRHALQYIHAREADWQVPVVTCSALKNIGISELWDLVIKREEQLKSSGQLIEKRQRQMLHWMNSLIDDRVRQLVRSHPEIVQIRQQVEKDVLAGSLPPASGADRIVEALTHIIQIDSPERNCDHD